MTTLTLGSPTLASDLSLPPQARIILAHLEAGKDITASQSMLVYHIYRLSDCILKIRDAGYDILTTMRKDEVGGKYASYSLAPKKVLH
ncbi:helix-turn-helix domain-containing protein [Bradyrhizobium quebecense]|uniref:DNA-binding protein n=1 Tax=Bradyrhizobium quebecense TaxID=2748629 RepID=A0A974AAV0_9BRAD|nr:helix-turn-helix domain-containing protein [Bradyrhizobium quebecense]UGA46831.1 helix-turn-helix domain-containing protein [Bradyrhizobium quebecense]